MMNYVSIFTLFLGPIKANFIGYWPVGKNSSLILQNKEKNHYFSRSTAKYSFGRR